jgi:hypothetical protein
MAEKKRIPDWVKKRNKRIQLYAKVVKATRKELKSQGKELTYKEARRFTSDFVYPSFKGQLASKVKIKDIRDVARSQFVEIAPPIVKQEFVDPRAITEDEASGITWFDIDGFLTGDSYPSMRMARALRDNDLDLRFEVIAGVYGRTGELNLSTYEYYSTGLQKLIENIRANNPNVGQEPYLSWEGYVGLRANATDLSDPNSYILQFILIENETPIVEPMTITSLPPQRVITPEDYDKLRKEQTERLKAKKEREAEKEEAEKKKARKKTKRPTKKQRVKEPIPIEKVPEEPKKGKSTRGERVIELNRLKLRELELLRADLDDKIITKAAYKKQRERIIANYEDAFKKLRRGGIV